MTFNVREKKIKNEREQSISTLKSWDVPLDSNSQIKFW